MHITSHSDIDPNRLFMVQAIVREIDENGKQIKDTACNPILGKGFDEEGNDIWEIPDKVLCEETNFVTKERYNFYAKNDVDFESLYKDIPKFGQWKDLITNTAMRFLDE